MEVGDPEIHEVNNDSGEPTISKNGKSIVPADRHEHRMKMQIAGRESTGSTLHVVL